MIHFAHICPTAYLSTYAKYNTAHLILAHLVEEDEQYRDFYKNLNDGNPKIMDNSAFEMWKRTNQCIQQISCWKWVKHVMLSTL